MVVSMFSFLVLFLEILTKPKNVGKVREMAAGYFLSVLPFSNSKPTTQRGSLQPIWSLVKCSHSAPFPVFYASFRSAFSLSGKRIFPAKFPHISFCQFAKMSSARFFAPLCGMLPYIFPRLFLWLYFHPASQNGKRKAWQREKGLLCHTNLRCFLFLTALNGKLNLGKGHGENGERKPRSDK